MFRNAKRGKVLKIRINRHGFDDFHASIEGHPELWGRGKTVDEAIGSMFRSHCEHFKCEGINYTESAKALMSEKIEAGIQKMLKALDNERTT